MLFKNITGKKTAKGFEEDAVIASPTTGEFKLTPSIIKMLGVKDGDTMLTLVGEDENGITVFIGKGRAGTPVLDAEGKEQKDERGRTIVEEGSDFGAIVRPAAIGSPLLAFTASMAWKQAGASTEFNTYFSVGEPIEVPVAENEEDENSPIFEGVFYPLTFDKKVAKMARKSKGEEGAEEEVATEVAEKVADSETATNTEESTTNNEFVEEEI